MSISKCVLIGAGTLAALFVIGLATEPSEAPMEETIVSGGPETSEPEATSSWDHEQCPKEAVVRAQQVITPLDKDVPFGTPTYQAMQVMYSTLYRRWLDNDRQMSSADQTFEIELCDNGRLERLLSVDVPINYNAETDWPYNPQDFFANIEIIEATNNGIAQLKTWCVWQAGLRPDTQACLDL